MYYGLPGRIQTVPFAELHAVVYVVSKAANGSSLVVVTDSSFVEKGFLGNYSDGPGRCLWKTLWKFVQDKQLHLQIRWAKAHVPEHPEYYEAYDCSWLDVVGNAAADILATDYGAPKGQLTLDITSKFKRLVSEVQLVQLRLIDMVKFHSIEYPHCRPSLALPPRVYPSLSLATLQSEHKVVICAQSVTCVNCFSSTRVNTFRENKNG